VAAGFAVFTCDDARLGHVPAFSRPANPALPFANPVSKPNDNPDEKFIRLFAF
jgi:hypothetical protein